MRRKIQIIGIALGIAIGAAAAFPVQAHESSSSKKGSEMMGGGNMIKGDMMGMMKMLQEMSDMMESCNIMMKDKINEEPANKP